MIKLKSLLSEGVRLDYITNQIKKLEDEWTRLDSQGTGYNRQLQITRELGKLKAEKENWEKIHSVVNEI
jgi:hypothetical protein